MLKASKKIQEGHTASSQDSNRLESQTPPVPDNTNHSAYQDTEQPREEYPNYYRPELEDIMELEDNEENWEEAQFADADLLIITTPQRKVIEYIMSTLHTLRWLQIRDTALIITEHQD